MSAPKIQPGSFLTLHYRLAGPDGVDLINTFSDKPATLSVGSGELTPGIEAQLIGLAEGERTTMELAPGVAFGPRNPELLQRVSMTLLRDHSPEGASFEVGDVIQFPGPDGEGGFAGVLKAFGPVQDDWALFDFNHPLAGLPVTFEVQVIGVL